jgi:hypothetical protein
MYFQLPKPMHGWRAFAGEVGIIVIGVLIALAAGQLVEWVHTRSEQHDTLERLFQESRVNVALLRRGREILARDAKQEDVFAAALTNGSCPPQQQWSAATNLIKYPQVAAETSVYDEVVGAGGLADIQSTRARDAISEFHSKLAWLENTTEFFRMKSERPYGLDDPRVTIVYGSKAEEPEVTSFDRDALCRDKGFANRVAVGTRNHIVWIGFHDQVVEAAIRMCGVLGRELGEACTPGSGPPLTPAEQRIAASTTAER